MTRRITQKVQALLENYAVEEVPVPVEKIAQSLGAELRYEPFEEDNGHVSGLLSTSDGRTIIGVNASDSEMRQRFTIAHEIGHLLLHADRTSSMYVDKVSDIFLRDELSKKATSVNEIEANKFAAELLMPERVVREEVQRESKSLMKQFQSVPDMLIIDRLANKFQVSNQAMTYRLANLGIIKI